MKVNCKVKNMPEEFVRKARIYLEYASDNGTQLRNDYYYFTGSLFEGLPYGGLHFTEIRGRGGFFSIYGEDLIKIAGNPTETLYRLQVNPITINYRGGER